MNIRSVVLIWSC